jgi:hypothetical protein
MTKLISIFAASALALSLSGMAFAADEKTQDQPAYPKAQDQTVAPKTQDQGAPPADLSKHDQEYFVALKKCDDMQGAEKQECIEQAKQKYNRM